MPQTIPVDSKTQIAYVFIRDRILSGEFPQGMPLSERKLSQMMEGISRTPIRAALSELCRNELATTTPTSGIIVSIITQQDIHEIYDIRLMLDAHALKLFINIATEQDLGQVRLLHEDLEAAIRSGDAEAMLTADRLFHRFYVARCGNNRLHHLINMNIDQYVRFRHFVVNARQTVSEEEIMAGHTGVVKGILKRDADMATAALADSYNRLKALHLTLLAASEAM
ncbi:GntR family transcriptional regulator [Eubacteriales bacterium OttesenSCG-928-A19]|nr:GntR family transcriptional regulator [Eubacteriales bacterium OttesenSCG-928-A19]